MKTIKIALLVVAMTFTATLSASTDPIKTPVSKIESADVAKAISRLLDKPRFEIKNELTAQVTFTLNGDNEIVVLFVNTEDETFENYIKSRLNYSKLNLRLKRNMKYSVPVRIKLK